MYFDQGSYVYVEDCNFIDNSNSGNGSAVYTIANSLDKMSTFKNCQFIRNHSDEKSVFFMITSQVRLEDCIFDSNTALESNPGLSLYLTNLEIKSCEFKNQILTTGGFITSSGGSNIIVKETKFNNSFEALTGGVIFITESKLFIEDCIIENI